MSNERLSPVEPFLFNKQEKLFNRLSDSRFQALLNDSQTTVHKLQVDSNSYGEFLFVTISHSEEGKQQTLTLFGYGYHEYRERWFTQEWFWYQSQPFPATLEERISREEADKLLQARRDDIAPYATQATQTRRGKLFEIIADLTDDDGAIAEMDD